MVILKGIGILLLVLIGLLLAFLLIVLLVPVRYRLDASIQDRDPHTVRIVFRISWLLHILRAEGSLENQRFGWRIVVFWKVLTGSDQETHGSEKQEKADGAGSEFNPASGQGTVQEAVRNSRQGTEQETVCNSGQDRGEVSAKEKQREEDQKRLEASIEKAKSRDAEVSCEKLQEADAEESGSSTKPEDSQEPEKNQESEHIEDTETCREAESISEHPVEEDSRYKRKERPSFGAWLWQCVQEAGQAVTKLWKTVLRILERIRQGRLRAESILHFFQREETKEVLRTLKKRLRRLLHHIRPRCLQLRLQFGLEDPAMTARLLEAAALLYPFYGKHMDLTPCFGEKALDGELHLRGRICLGALLWIALQLLLDRNVRVWLRQVKSLSGEKNTQTGETNKGHHNRRKGAGRKR